MCSSPKDPLPNRRLANKVAIVTGSGIGRAEATCLAGAGASVVVNDVAFEAAAAVATQIRATGGSALANPDTVATLDGGARVVRAALEAFGRLDILINNTGIGRKAEISEMSEEDWDITVAVDLKGCFTTVRRSAGIFRAQRSGRCGSRDPFVGELRCGEGRNHRFYAGDCLGARTL